jgi:uncharacterized protein (TIGR03086 family)
VDELPDRYRRAARRFGELVGAIRQDQWTNATPCTEWNVRALVSHVHGETLWVPELFGGKTIADIGDRLDGDLLGDDPSAAWSDAERLAVGAITAPDAMERTVHLSAGDTSGRGYAQELFLDLVIHGWDLARGIGADDTIDPDWVRSLYEDLVPREQELRSWDVFGDTVIPPDGADLQTRLLAVTGRVR